MTDVIFPVYEKLKKMTGERSSGPVKAFIQVFLKEKTSGKDRVVLKKVAKKLAKYGFVEKVVIVAGECDIVLQVSADDVFELGKFVSEDMRELKGVEKTITMIVLDEVK